MNEEIETAVGSLPSLQLQLNKGEKHRVRRPGLKGSLWLEKQGEAYRLKLTSDLARVLEEYVVSKFGKHALMDQGVKVWKLPSIDAMRRVVRELAEIELGDGSSPGTRRDWSKQEVAACIEDYFGMLAEELQGRTYNKTEHRRMLRTKLNSRSEPSIEFKHCNVSAALSEMGLPYIDGYKPRGHGQYALATAIEDYLSDHEEVSRLLKKHADSPPDEQENELGALIQVDPPEESSPLPAPKGGGRGKKVDYASRESRNRKLGEAGESMVVEWERDRLRKAGQADVAEKVEWTSKTQGDGTGYDILSFDAETGDQVFIEVKTTKCGKEQPFIVSANEVEFSRKNAASFRLYRVFGFGKAPQFYVLEGSLLEACQLQAKDYSAKPALNP